jgi:cytochrome c oxidase subunit 2
MAPQQIAGFVFLACLVVLAAGFISVAASAKHGPDDYEAVTHAGYRVRRYWFITLMIGGLVALGLTLPHMPYPLVRKVSANTPLTVVHVRGQQWQWAISPSTVPANRTIEFEVTSADVNHGFAVFDPSDNEIVANVQAMPGYTNRLYVSFHHPGTYLVRCLELCGLYHTSMQSQITVTGKGASTGGSASSGQPPAAACSPAGTSLTVTAHNIHFSKSCLAAPAGQAFTVTFTNDDSGVPHNIAIYTDSSASKSLFKGQIVTGTKTVVYHVPALSAGTYYFRCDVHPTTMHGTFVVK